MKVEASKNNAFAPKPLILVSCRDKKGNENALAVAYCGNCSYDPPMLMVGIVPSRASYPMIKEAGCLVVNLVPKSYKKEFNYLGSVSRRDEDKLVKGNIKTAPAKKIPAPILSDCPVNIECTIVDSIMTGSHEMFACKIEYVNADPAVVGEDGKIDFSKIDLM